MKENVYNKNEYGKSFLENKYVMKEQFASGFAGVNGKTYPYHSLRFEEVELTSFQSLLNLGLFSFQKKYIRVKYDADGR